MGRVKMKKDEWRGAQKEIELHQPNSQQGNQQCLSDSHPEGIRTRARPKITWRGNVEKQRQACGWREQGMRSEQKQGSMETECTGLMCHKLGTKLQQQREKKPPCHLPPLGSISMLSSLSSSSSSMTAYRWRLFPRPRLLNKRTSKSKLHCHNSNK